MRLTSAASRLIDDIVGMIFYHSPSFRAVVLSPTCCSPPSQSFTLTTTNQHLHHPSYLNRVIKPPIHSTMYCTGHLEEVVTIQMWWQWFAWEARLADAAVGLDWMRFEKGDWLWLRVVPLAKSDLTSDNTKAPTSKTKRPNNTGDGFLSRKNKNHRNGKSHDGRSNTSRRLDREC